MLHHQGNLTIRLSSEHHPKHLQQVLNSQNVFCIFFQRFEIVLYSSRLNGGNAGNVKFDIAIVV